MGVVTRGPARKGFREALLKAIEDLGPAGARLLEEYGLAGRLGEVSEEEALRVLKELARRGLIRRLPV